jgi:hypothetical protein
MDSDDEEMIAALLKEEPKPDAVVANDDEHMEILAALIAMYAKDSKPLCGGSKPGQRKSKPRQRFKGHCMLSVDYFADDPVHGDLVFQRRFRMNRKLFMKILFAVREYDTYFICKVDCVSTIGFSSNQKCTTALRDASL